MLGNDVVGDLPVGFYNYCQICASGNLEVVVDLGNHAPCDSLLTSDQIHEMEKTYPLRFLLCTDCKLAQIDYVVPPEELFYPEYPYRTGITETLKSYMHGMAQRVVKKAGIGEGSLVIDIGSNDGTLLQGFKSLGMRVLGVEPTNVAKIAIKNGIDTVNDFFGEDLAKEILAEYGQATMITGTNVFAHMSNLGSLFRGISCLLGDKGIFLTESHYLLDLLETVQYDSIYHEHLRYYSLRPMIQMMTGFGFRVVDVERIPNYGGSIRVYAVKSNNYPVSERVDQLLALEKETGIYDMRAYDNFREKTLQSRFSLQSLMLDLRKQGKRVPGIACPGRASTLLNYCKIDSELMPYIAEQSTSLKLGLYLPGMHIPIIDEETLFSEQPEYAVMLSWHYAEPIIKKLRQKGLRSKIIVPLPEVHIIED